MAKRIAHGINGEVFKSEGGDHVLLSIEDYNKIVRSLNLLAILAASIENTPDKTLDNVIKVLRQQHLEVIEDE